MEMELEQYGGEEGAEEACTNRWEKEERAERKRESDIWKTEERTEEREVKGVEL